MSIIVLAEALAIHLYGGVFLAHFAGGVFHVPIDLNSYRYHGGEFGHHPVASLSGPMDWMYPPPALLLAAPLAWISPAAAYAVWSAAGVTLMVIAGRAAGIRWGALTLGLISPPALYCLAIGQISEITSAFLILSMALEARPVLAGIFAGALVVKPQLGLLLPICFMASRNWRALLSAGATVMLLCGLTTVFFGFHAWVMLISTQPQMAAAMLNRAPPQPYEGIMVSAFMLMRSLGAGLYFAYAVQSLSTLAAIVTTWWVWRPHRQMPLAPRLALTLCLVPLATPYAQLYDLPALAMAMAGYAASRHWRHLAPLELFWLVTAGYVLISRMGCTAGAILFLLLILAIFNQERAWLSRQTDAQLAPAASGGRH